MSRSCKNNGESEEKEQRKEEVSGPAFICIKVPNFLFSKREAGSLVFGHHLKE
jgi:hypothetical protein